MQWVYGNTVIHSIHRYTASSLVILSLMQRVLCCPAAELAALPGFLIDTEESV